MFVLCAIAGKRCLSFEGYRLVWVSVLNDQRTPGETGEEETGSKETGVYHGLEGAGFVYHVSDRSDGAPWIWSRAEELSATRFPDKERWQVLDYTHAKQALEEILDFLPVRCKEADKDPEDLQRCLMERRD